MRHSLLITCAALACNEPKDRQSSPLFGAPIIEPRPTDDTAAPTPSVIQVYGPSVNSGFGSVVLVAGSRVWVGAPHGDKGSVYEIKDGVAVERVTGSGRLGSSLAMTADGLWIGAPVRKQGKGAVVDVSGDVVVNGTGSTGIAVAAGPPAVVAHGDGYTEGDGPLTPTDGRPSSIATLGTQVGIGMAQGDVALIVGRQVLARPSPQDQAGFSLTSGDLDGDGQLEWILGAPGANAVYVVDPDTMAILHTISSDRALFGSSVAACDLDGSGADDLLVGAPGDELTAGTASRYQAPLTESTPSRTWTGTDQGRRLGTAIACSTTHIAIGAPGRPDTPGSVTVVVP